MSADGLREDAWQPSPPDPEEDERDEEEEKHRSLRRKRVSLSEAENGAKLYFPEIATWDSDGSELVTLGTLKESHSRVSSVKEDVEDGSDGKSEPPEQYRFGDEFKREAQTAVLPPLFRAVSAVGAVISALFTIVFLIGSAYILSAVFATGFAFTVYAYRTGLED